MRKLIKSPQFDLDDLQFHQPDLPHHWLDSDLAELQWPALSRAARCKRKALQELTHDEIRAHDIVQQHALAIDGQEWLIPACIHLPRTAPHGGQFTRCCDTGDLVLLGEPGLTRSISSGWRSNDELLLTEGWASASLESDRIELPLESLHIAADVVVGADGLKQRRLQVLDGLRDLGYLPDRPFVLANGHASDSLGKVLQALVLSSDEFELYGDRGCVINIGEAVPLSMSQERRVGLLLECSCQQLLGAFETSIEEDEAILVGIESSARSRLKECVRARLSRKRCLLACQNRARVFVEQPTATATLRRPWCVNIRTSG